MQTKQDWRDEIVSKLESQTSDERLARSRVIQEKLFSLLAFRKALAVCTYVSRPIEVDTTAVIDRALGWAKKVLVPRTDLIGMKLDLYEIHNRGGDLEKGVLGIMEPLRENTRRADPREADIVIVPGLVFDRQKNRLGYGKGFYDRFLASLRPGTLKVGLAFSFQLVDSVPAETHDQKLDTILTD